MSETEPGAATLHELKLIGLLGRMYACAPDDVRAVDLAVDLGPADGTLSLVQRAMANCVGGDLAGSRATLEQHIETHPEDDMAKIVLGASLLMSGDRSGRSWMDTVLVMSSNPAMREAALKVIGLMEPRRRR
jgi:hypothetical protein